MTPAPATKQFLNSSIYKTVSSFDKIQELIRKTDTSSELKKGEIKHILIKAAADQLPGFEYLGYRNSCYTFQRLRSAHEITVYETLHIIFTLKNKNFSCSIASCINPAYIHSNSYNTGLINPHVDLKVLKHDTGTLKIEDAYYFHNGKVETTTKTVGEIFRDYRKYGLRFLDDQLDRLNTSAIVLKGLEFINTLTVDKENLKKEIANELIAGKFLVSSVKSPAYLDLKAKLQSIKGQERKDRQKIPKAALELLDIYCKR